MRSEVPGFSWYKKRYCQLKCPDCGVKARFDNTVDVDSGSSPAVTSTVNEICDCEFDCNDDNGSLINVVVKVKMYCEQERSGSFRKKWKKWL